MQISLHYWLLQFFFPIISQLYSSSDRLYVEPPINSHLDWDRDSHSMKDIKIVVFKPFLCSFVLLCLGSLSCRNTNQVFLQDFPVFYCIHLFTLYPNKPSRPCCKKIIHHHYSLWFGWCGVFGFYLDVQKTKFWSRQVSEEFSSSWSPTYLLWNWNCYLQWILIATQFLRKV